MHPEFDLYSFHGAFYLESFRSSAWNNFFLDVPKKWCCHENTSNNLNTEKSALMFSSL